MTRSDSAPKHPPADSEIGKPERTSDRWVRSQLALMAGNDLPRVDADRMERRCQAEPKLASELTQLRRVVDLLHEVAAEEAEEDQFNLADSVARPSLWPQLAQQIEGSSTDEQVPALTRDSRHRYQVRVRRGVAWTLALAAILSLALVLNSRRLFEHSYVRLSTETIDPQSLAHHSPSEPVQPDASFDSLNAKKLTLDQLELSAGTKVTDDLPGNANLKRIDGSSEVSQDPGAGLPEDSSLALAEHNPSETQVDEPVSTNFVSTEGRPISWSVIDEMPPY